jgi:hypothetical protein
MESAVADHRGRGERFIAIGRGLGGERRRERNQSDAKRRPCTHTYSDRFLRGNGGLPWIHQTALQVA